MKIGHALPFFLAAEAAAIAPDSWGLTLANYGVATGMLAWFMWKDRVDRQERNDAQRIQQEERKAQQIRHEENLEAFKKIEDAYRTNTDLLIVGLGAMKTIDAQYISLLEKIKNANAPK